MAGRIELTCPRCGSAFAGDVSPAGGEVLCPSCGAAAGRFDPPEEALLDDTSSFPRPFGPYDLLGEIGRGAGGVVYRARHRELHRVVALKRMVLQESDAARTERQAREARLAARVRHPNLVTVLESGHLGPYRWFTMPLYPGGSLRERMAREGPIPVAAACRITAKVARGLAAAHAEGIVHRDVKPANILFDERGEPALGDFGLARDLSTPRGVTRTGDWVGTPAYMAPEQIGGKPGTVGPAADLYALGAILYEMTTGRPPFRGETLVDLSEAILIGRFPPPTSVRPGLCPGMDSFCRRVLSGIPHSRHPSALALAEDLESIAEMEERSGAAVSGRAGTEETGTVPLRRWFRRAGAVPVSPVSVWLTAAALAAVVTVVAWSVGGRESLGAAGPPGPRIVLSAAPVPARVVLLRAGGRVSELGVTPVTVRPAAAKGAAFRFDAPGRLPAVLRLWIDPADEFDLSVRLLAPAELPEGMAYVPAGPYRASRPGEAPVTLRVEGFLIDRDEVTNAEYARFLTATGRRPPSHWRGGVPAGAEGLPAIDVTAEDAGAFAQWAGKRLPTEAEWEKAARGGDGRRFPWGDAADAARLRCGEAVVEGPAAPGSYPGGESPYGVRDLAGNVREWTSTPHPSDPARRIVKGGGWRSPLPECDAGWRDYVPVTGRERDLGFRCAKELP